jgi:hypothetical protein
MTHDQIVNFYVQNLGSDWRQVSRYDVPIDIPPPNPHAVHGTDTEVTFRSGDATVFLSMMPVEGSDPNITIHSPNDYGVAVDAHRGNGTGCPSD